MKNDGQNWNSGCIRKKIYDVHLLNINLEIFEENCQRYPIDTSRICLRAHKTIA